jgi:wobble nucleotide-excising tRNase
MNETPFADLKLLAEHLRNEMDSNRQNSRKFILIYAYNGTGKTRLSTEFKNLGKIGDERDTLYFNAFTEDLFSWDNDLKNDRERVLKINRESRFFAGLDQFEMDNRIRPLLDRYTDFDFKIDTNEWEVSFSRAVTIGDGANTKTETVDDIKVSRGEENIFIWCFFLAIVQLVLAKEEPYKWVKYLYIDDPISSLDEHNAIMVANHLAQLLIKTANPLKTVISSHHTLFFNVLGNELGSKARRYFLSKGPAGYLLRDTGNTPSFHHVASLRELCQAAESGELRTHHFNVLRSIMDKTASFHGYLNFGDCIQPTDDDPDKTMYTRVINIMSHGNYSLYEPMEMMDENKEIFRKLLRDFRKNFPFNPKLFGDQANDSDTE